MLREEAEKIDARFFQMFPFQDSDGDLISDGVKIVVLKCDPNDLAETNQMDGDDGQRGASMEK